MAYSEDSVSTGEALGVVNRAPMFVATNVLDDYVTMPEWRVSGSWASGTDITSATYPTRYLWDRDMVNQSVALCSGQTEVSLLLDLTADADTAFDTVFLLNHNFHELGGNLTITLQISDSSSFAGAVTLATWTNPTTSLRLGNVRLNAILVGKRYSNAQYVRLRLVKSSGTFAAAVRLGELWLGRRRQMVWPPVLPYDESSTRSIVDDSDDGGAIVRSVRNYGGRTVDMSLLLEPASDDNGSLDCVDELRSWWAECNHGASPTLVITDPYPTNPGENCLLAVPTDDRLQINYRASLLREATVRLVESAPYLSAEV